MAAKNRIGLLRREAGMNQKELGTKLGVGQTTVSAWETGKNEPDNESMHKMAELFHASIGYIMGYEKESIFRGLSKEKFIEWQAELQRKMHAEEIEETIRETIEAENPLTPKEQREWELANLEEEWENSGPADTIEGFEASKLVSALPSEKRKWAIRVIRELLKKPE